jgi:hypothetical protein
MKGEIKMENQKIFETLADLECELFGKWTDMAKDEPNYEEMKTAHELVKKALVTFANATGCHN